MIYLPAEVMPASVFAALHSRAPLQAQSAIQFLLLMRDLFAVATLLVPELKCQKCVCSRGCAPGPSWGSLQRFPDPI